MIGFLIVVILGPIFIPMLARFKFGQTVRDEGPQSHLAKNGTPTMGGVMMIASILIRAYKSKNKSRTDSWTYLYSRIWFCRIFR